MSRRQRAATGPVLGLMCALLVPSSAATPPNLYEWMAVAPVVVAGRVLVDDERYIGLQITKRLRGEVASDHPVEIDQRSANRDREPGTTPLRMEKGRAYLVLLEPETPKRSRGRARYRITRGTQGVREVPKEGAATFLEAADRMAQVQAFKDDSLQWQAFRQMLEETNPLLVDTALEMFLKFRRAEPDLVPVIHPLLDHPRPEVRAEAAQLIGQVLEKGASAGAPEESSLAADLVSRARRDASVEVRVAATVSLGAMTGSRTDEVLRQIAQEDPDQAVRYAAERALYERGLEGRTRTRRD